jgi:hypothetical protein
MINYEWDIETADEFGDVEDHDASEKLRPYHLDLEPTQKLVLVCDNWEGGWMYRSWAYVEDFKLPEFLVDAYGTEARRVPQRFHKELAKSLRAK